MEYTFGYGYGYGYVHVYVHDARLVQLFIIGAPKYCVIFGSNDEYAEQLLFPPRFAPKSRPLIGANVTVTAFAE